MPIPRIYCPTCGQEIPGDKILDDTKDSGYVLCVNVDCPTCKRSFNICDMKEDR